MDRVASRGVLGWVQTVPPGCEPGSDIANLSLLGYDPVRYHTGRAPLEAAALGLRLQAGEIAFRCNLVHLDFQARGAVRMGSYSAQHISTEEARNLAPVYAPLEPDKRGQQQEACRVMPDSVLFRVQKVDVDLTPYDLPGPTRSKVACARCGQVVRDHREVIQNGVSLCRPCAGGAYFKTATEIAWDDMNWSPQPQMREIEPRTGLRHLKERPVMLS